MLTKGFLSRKPVLELSRRQLLIGALMGLGYATAMCCFFIYLREFWRLRTIEANFEDLLTLSVAEGLFYDYFIAAISFVAGFAIAINYWMIGQRSSRLQAQRIWVDANVLTWYFIHIIFKVSLYYGVFAGSLGTFLYVSVIREYWLFFVISPIVLFLHQWLKIRAYFRNSLKWMGATALAMIVFSATMALLPIADPSAVNDSILRTSPNYFVDIELPRSKVRDRQFRYSLVEQLYIGKRKTDTTQVAFYADHGSPRELTPEMIQEFVGNAKDKLVESERYLLEMQLYIDKGVSTAVINSLLLELRKADARRIRFIVASTSRQAGLPFLLPCHPEQTNPAPVPCTGIPEAYHHPKKMIVELKRNEIYAGGWKVNKEELTGMLADHVMAYPDAGIEFIVDDYSSYGRMFTMYESLYRVRAHVRRDVIFKKFAINYDSGEYLPEADRYALDRYPEITFTYSEEERAAAAKK